MKADIHKRMEAAKPKLSARSYPPPPDLVHSASKKMRCLQLDSPYIRVGSASKTGSSTRASSVVSDVSADTGLSYSPDSY